MDNYYIPPKTLYHLLKDKGVNYFYHANTVLTSLTFIENRALLSRAYVENNNLTQTPQKSDNDDKRYDVWDNVFLDGLDLHKRFSNANKYGPILFVLKLEILLLPSMPKILITKNNPWYWKPSTKTEDRYYSNIEDLSKDYLTGKILDSRIMFTFRSPNTFIRLNKFLQKIIIDKPTILLRNRFGEQKNVGDFAYEIICTNLEQHGLSHIPVEQRHQDQTIHFCKCNFTYNYNYTKDSKEFKKHFNPKYK
jgi:hypothetical protein